VLLNAYFRSLTTPPARPFVRKRASAPNGTAPAQMKFLEWLRKEKPEVLAGGKFA
jgi:hypothetical protein